MENYEVSVAMATYQGATYISDQLASILHQTQPPVEILVCDDCSADDTVQIVKEYGREINLQVHINPSPLGVLNNFAKAISLCSSSYIALSDQDDVWVSTKLEDSINKMKIIEKDKNLPALVFSDLEVVDKELQIINRSLWVHLGANPSRETFYTLLFGNVVTGCTILFNRRMAQYLAQVPQKAIMHDYWAALIAFGFGQVGLIEAPLVKYRQHDKNVTYNFERNVRNRLRDLYSTIVHRHREFLRDELEQATEFHRLFGSQLPSDKRKDLEQFLKLKSSGFLRRKWESFRSNNFN